MSRRVLASAALLATYMAGANISLPNAALPHMQGTLSMSDDEIGWIFTAYVTAGVVVMPMTRWLALRFGHKRLFEVSLAVFALGLVLDTLAATPIQFVFARIVQGAASGPLAPLSLAVLLDIMPPERHARYSLASGAAMLFGISSGPAIGGWFSEYHGWHSIFYLSLPLTGFILAAVAACLDEKRAEQVPSFDFFGLATFSLGLVGLQMLLDRGERMEWFASPEIWIEAASAVLGFYLFFVHMLTTDTHFLDKALFRDRNFILSTIMFFAIGFVLLPTLALTSPMLENLLGYPVDTTGYMAIPRGAALVSTLVAMRFTPARLDNRFFVLGGIGAVAYANWLMLGYSPLMDWRPVAMAGLLQGIGLGVSIPALTKAAFSTLDPKFRPEGTALFNLVRLYGSTIGIGVVQIFFYDNSQALHLSLAKNLTPAHAAVSTTAALAGLNDAVSGQAAMVAILAQFKILLLAVLVVSPLALFLRRPRPASP